MKPESQWHWPITQSPNKPQSSSTLQARYIVSWQSHNNIGRKKFDMIDCRKIKFLTVCSTIVAQWLIYNLIYNCRFLVSLDHYVQRLSKLCVGFQTYVVYFSSQKQFIFSSAQRLHASSNKTMQNNIKGGNGANITRQDHSKPPRNTNRQPHALNSVAFRPSVFQWWLVESDLLIGGRSVSSHENLTDEASWWEC